MREKKEVPEHELYRRRVGRFATKIRKQMKKNGLRSGELLLEYWTKPNPSPSSLEMINLKQEDIQDAIKLEIGKYKEALEYS